MNKTNCVNCGAPIENGRCRYCGTRNTFIGNYGKTSSNAPVDLNVKMKAIIGAFVLLSIPFHLLKK